MATRLAAQDQCRAVPLLLTDWTGELQENKAFSCLGWVVVTLQNILRKYMFFVAARKG